MAAESVRVRRVLELLAAVAALCLVAAAVSAGALAADPASLLYQGRFGPDGTESSDFDKVGSIAGDQTSGTAHAIGRAAGILYKFDQLGHPTGQISGLNFFHG